MHLAAHAQHEIDNDGCEQEEAEYGRAEAVIVRAGATLADGRCSPVVGDECVRHGAHSDECEECGRIPTNAVAKVEETYSKAANNDGEIQPREEGALIGEKDFRFYSHR